MFIDLRVNEVIKGVCIERGAAQGLSPGTLQRKVVWEDRSLQSWMKGINWWIWQKNQNACYTHNKIKKTYHIRALSNHEMQLLRIQNWTLDLTTWGSSLSFVRVGLWSYFFFCPIIQQSLKKSKGSTLSITKAGFVGEVLSGRRTDSG